MCDQETLYALHTEIEEASRDYERKALRLAKLTRDDRWHDYQLTETQLAGERHEAFVTAAQIVGAL